MKITRITTSLLVILFTCTTAYSQSQSSSLLWRISGRGLDKPSYLYGTIHLKDRRLFFFGDSLYSSIEGSAGFAMEIDPNEMMDSVFSRMSADNSPLLKDVLKKDEYKKASKKLEKNLGIAADKITKKQLVESRRALYYKSNKPDDMNTVVDLYLFDIARRLGKWVGGIEDVDDQLSIVGEMGNDIDINQYLEEFDDSKRNSYIEKMINVYVKQDINGIDEMIDVAAGKSLEMIKRNIKMARRMDSLAHIRNSFFAVGAAHLPGDSGVISLLRSKGFTVEPVYSSKKIAPGKYVVKETELKWQKITGADSAYTIDMPGKPSDLKLFGDDLTFKVYTDMVNSVAYMSGYIITAEGDSSQVIERLLGSYKERGFRKLAEKQIMQQGNAGLEVIYSDEQLYYRFHFFSMAGKVYLIVKTANKKEFLYAPDAEHYFGSFAPNTNLLVKPKNWSDFSDSLRAFTISIPGKPVTNTAPSDQYENISYSAIDLAHGTYYLVAINDTKKGFFITEDSIVFNSKLDYYTEKNFTNSDIRKFEFNGFPAVSFTTRGESDGTEVVCKMLVIVRGNRCYNLAAITQKGMEDFPDVTKFFRSFSLLPYKTAGWSTTTAAANSFSTWAPSPIELPVPVIDTTAFMTNQTIAAVDEDADPPIYTAYDAASATTFDVKVEPASRYFWTRNDSSFFNDKLSQYYEDTGSYRARYLKGNYDSLLYKKVISNGNAPGYELLVKNNSKTYYSRIRLLRNGDTAYHLSAVGPYSFLFGDNCNRFFSDFRFTKETPAVRIFEDKMPLILAEISSTDSATRARCAKALNEKNTERAALPLLQQAFVKAGDKDSAGYYAVAELIARKMERVDTLANLAFAKEHFYTISGSKKLFLLQLLASNHTAGSIQQLKEMLKPGQAVTGNPYSFISDLRDSLPLAKQLFPGIEPLFADTVLGPGFISLANDLVDSGMLNKDFFTGHASLVVQTANRLLNKLKYSGDEFIPYQHDMVDALTKIGDKDAVAVLYSMAVSKGLYTKQAAVLALLKLDKTVPPAAIQQLSADLYNRVEFYTELKKIGKETLFPKALLTQQKFAESYVYSYISEEEEMDGDNTTFKLLGEKTLTEKGITSRYYIYQVQITYGDDKYNYPAVCGPFNLNRQEVLLNEELSQTRIFYDEKLKKAGIEAIFQAFVKEKNSE